MKSIKLPGSVFNCSLFEEATMLIHIKMESDELLMI